MLRRLRPLRLPLALLALTLPAACGSMPSPLDSQAGMPLAPRSGAGRPAGADDQPGTDQTGDLMPLPSARTVLSQVPIGRADPFAPLQVNQPAPVTIALPTGFRLRGVLSVGGRDQAFVQTADGSGVVCLGAQGRCSAGSTPLLPQGTAVVAIQPRLGCIVVAASDRRQRYCLQDS